MLLLSSAVRQVDDLLLRPVASQVGDRPLVVVPTERMQSVPWGLLPSLTGRPVSVAPSAALWLQAAERTPMTGPVLLAAGPELPGARREVDEIARLYPNPVVLAGRNCSVGRVADALQRSRLAHLAAHGAFRADNPLFSSLLLADGPLTVHDLELLRRVPQIVVLAACDSAQSLVCAGNELLGPAATFLSLGTSALVGSVVPVPDSGGCPVDDRAARAPPPGRSGGHGAGGRTSGGDQRWRARTDGGRRLHLPRGGRAGDDDTAAACAGRRPLPARQRSRGARPVGVAGRAEGNTAPRRSCQTQADHVLRGQRGGVVAVHGVLRGRWPAARRDSCVRGSAGWRRAEPLSCRGVPTSGSRLTLCGRTSLFPAAGAEGLAMNLPYVGRAAEMQGLHRALEEARRGQTVAVFVSGEAGVGKSRLISEFAAEIAGSGVIVLTGTCLDVGEDAPLWPVADVLGRLLRGRQSAATIELLRPWWGQLKRLLPMPATPASPTPTSWPASPAPPEALSGAASSPAAAWEASGERQHVSTLVEVLLQVVIALAGRRPVVLCLEDLQWADRSTRNLLVFLLANLSAEPVLVICSYRPDALGGTHPLRKLLPELRRNRRSRWVELRPLQRGDVDQLVAATLGGDARDQATELVWSRGEGHPLYTEEFLHALTHGDVTEVPQTLRELLLNQVALLPFEARQVVRAVATGFEPLSHDVLATVVDLPEEALLPAIRAAVDGLVLSADSASAGYRLRHGFFREVVESELLPGERAVLHRRHAQALERRPEKGHAYLARLAHHWQRSGDAQRALVALIAAAEEAERFYGFAEAFHHWTAAVALCDVVPGGRPKAALIERAAQTAHLSGNHDDAVRLLCAPLDALPASAVDERRQLLARRGGYLLAAGRVRDAVAEYEQAAALPIAGRADEEAQAAVLGGLAEALLMAGRYADARAVARQALAMGQGVASPARAAPALITLGVSKAYLEDHAAGVADLRKSLDIADRGRHPEDLGRAFVHLAEVLAGPVNQPDEGVAIARGRRQGGHRPRDRADVRRPAAGHCRQRALPARSLGRGRAGGERRARPQADRARCHRRAAGQVPLARRPRAPRPCGDGPRSTRRPDRGSRRAAVSRAAAHLAGRPRDVAAAL